MGKKPRLQVRCEEETKNKYAQASDKFGMSYGEFALFVSLFVMENEDDFRRFVTRQERKREK